MRPEAPLDPEPRQVTVAARTIAYTETGTDTRSGFPVVAIHGLPASSRDFRWLDAAFAGRVRFLRLDLPGFGKSAPSPIDSKEQTFEGMGQFVASFCEALDLNNVVLLGHSMGGAIALEAAAVSDRVAGVVFVNSSGSRMHKGNFARTYRVALALADRHRLLRRAVLGLFKPVARRVGFSKRLSDDELVLGARLASRYSPAAFGARLRQLELPTLVAWASRDPGVQPTVSKAILADAQDGTDLCFDAKTHNLQSSHATELADAIVEWSSSIASDPNRRRGAAQ